MNGVFCGNGTLLIQCADAFEAKGGVCQGVITSDAQILSWAGSKGYRVLGTPAAPEIGDVQMDWLFSVANLHVLSDDLISRPKKGAINFHDGPLPAMAGLNVPVWAILSRHGRHAVTWHEMASRVDAGGIFKSRSFPIAASETSFSLNAKCYEAGLESFGELLDDLFAQTLVATPQQGDRQWYAGAKRPVNLGLLSFEQPAADMSALVRALDFGNYHNPLAAAKLWTGERLLKVGKLKVTDARHGAPGEVISIADGALTVAAGDGQVELSGLQGLSGEHVDPAGIFAVGDVLPAVNQIAGDDLVAIGKAEAHWNGVLSGAVPAMPPYPQSVSDRAEIIEAALDLPDLSPSQLASAYLAWLGGLGDQAAFTIGVHLPAAHPTLSNIRPVHLSLGAGDTVASIAGQWDRALDAAKARAPMPMDLVSRMPDDARRETAKLALSVVFAAQGDNADLLSEAGFALVADRPRFVARDGLFRPEVLSEMARQFSRFARHCADQPDLPLAELALVDHGCSARANDAYDRDLTLQAAFDQQAEKTPDATALEAGGVVLTYGALKARSEQLAGALVDRGAGPGMVVGLCMERSAEMIVALMAILKTGAAYLPLDPDYPADRIAFMIEDSAAALVVASAKARAVLDLDPKILVAPDATSASPAPMVGSSDDLAYLIYTSGSTGTPKGVMVPHRCVQNFFAGMDQRIPHTDAARFLAVTSVSFDISVLEIFWVLTRGMTLVLQTDTAASSDLPGFSLFYFASEVAGTGHHAYRLLLEGAKFADENGFEAIWTPERHFHAFGGLYPNPAISAAMLAGITKNVKLRAGSSVVPLHHPVRVAEDWALVDNLSNGRAGIAIAAGWQPNDFIVRPDAFADRKEIMLDSVDTLRALWRGEPQSFDGHDGKPVDVEIHPKPMQEDLPLWLTAAGNPETFAAAARKGCGVLTHLLGQTIEEVAEKIKAYRVAWREAGHPGNGTVTLMLHSFVGEDEDTVRETVRGPMKSYLKSAVDLVKRASWTFPTIVERANAAGKSPVEMFEQEELSAEDLDQLLDHAFERYYMTSGLFGTTETAKDIVRQVAAIGVDEVGCLIDFGVDTDVALANLPNIKKLMDGLEAEGGVGRKASVAEEIVEREITHLQCTPSMASMLAADEPGQRALSHLEVLMVGGEALPVDLAQNLRRATGGKLFNMYGPTETTIWSSCAELDQVGDTVPLGEPIANTMLDICSASGRSLPDLVAGELWIGGEGVTKGYWNRPDLTAERFVETDAGVFYKTGDLVRRHPNGQLEFLGRIDNQVKIRGHRIELGEIEARLSQDTAIAQAVVTALEFGAGDVRLIGYVTAAGAQPDVAALKSQLAETLPEFMVPSQIVALDRMPLTPNGKIDRNALPHPKTQQADGPAEAAENDTEATIYQVWRDALGLERFSVNSNFFDLGGHSLLVVQVQRELKERLGRDISITDVFRYPTVRKLAEFLGGDAQPEKSAANRGAARAAARLARMGRR